ncbi:GNAT family N-acetyltransferase [Nocardiopsis sp. HNM0947]|uniref:GNAT family N-acetyltransferase n=1 Tax=Nocardiopsis coralli TaxID=2772213 RepID=A0ABR9PC54_9ACTN|nr:GNAT family N-acetyltransferase [Nocardiopsis coralli]MBE3001421.1 GNAT family N-acetyltransferase [Nocardiopsis coralli]
MQVRVREMRSEDTGALAEVNLAAGRMFADAGIELPPDDPEETFDHAEAVLVAEDPGTGRVLGSAAVGTVDGALHLEELAVDPAVGRRGVGSRLLEEVCARARAQGRRAVTLTTFRDLSWNGPWYARRGFREVPEAEWGPQLHRLWEDEAPIRVAPRVVMRREV